MRDIITNEKALVISIIILTAFSAFLYINQPNQQGQVPSYSSTEIILKALYSFLSSLYVLIIIRVIRGKVKKSNKSPYLETELNVWDYVWRYFVVAWLASFSIIASLFLPMDTFFGKGIFTILLAVLIPLIVLILFGENRVNKIKNFIGYFSGTPKM